MRSIVTTKHGDAGQTTALSGEHLSKAHPIMECVGCLDELRAQTALVRLLVLQERPDGEGGIGEFLLWLLHVYFIIGSQCSDPLNQRPKYRIMDLSSQHLDRLEQEQARLEAQLALPKAFIVSATTPLAAQVDVACTAARRFERSLVRLKNAVPEFDVGALLPFTNRLSDYLYILARHIEAGNHLPVDYSALDQPPRRNPNAQS